MNSKRIWQIGNILSLVFALITNYAINTQVLDVPSIRSISDTYATFLTPATYAFSIWSLIYAYLLVFAVYQVRHAEVAQKVGPFFMLANICNGLWTYIFVKEWVGLSVVVLMLLTASLYAIIWRLRIALDDVPRATILGVWWPLSLYAGWVTVATVVNMASWLDSRGVVLGVTASCATIVGLALVLLGLLVKRQVRELVLAGAWGIAAIGFRQSQLDGSEAVMITAWGVSVVLVVAAAAHAYRNRHANSLLANHR